MTTTVAIPTREALLDAASVQLQSVGWTSFSFRDLAEQVGIRTASIHYHFPTKADLGVALVTWMRRQRDEKEQQLVAMYPAVPERFLALGQMIQERTCIQDRSCPIYALQAEYQVLPAPVQQAVKAWIDDCITGLTRWLDEGRTAGSLRFPGEPRTQALLVWSVLQQGTQLHRTHTDISYQTLVHQLVCNLTFQDTP